MIKDKKFKVLDWWPLQGGVSSLRFASPITLGTNYNFQDRNPNYTGEPGVFYDAETRDTIMSTAAPWTTTYASQARLHKYNALSGSYSASIRVGEKQPSLDNHMTSTLFVGSDYYFVLQENSHVGNLDMFKVSKDFTTSEKLATQTGLFARLQPRKTGTNSFNLLFQYDAYDIYFKSYDGDTDTWGADTAIVTSPRRAYCTMPVGQYTDVNGWHYISLTVLNLAQTGYNVRILIKTQDYVTFYNIDESENFTGNVDISTLVNYADKWIYYGDYSSNLTGNLGSVVSCIDNDGNYYDPVFVPGANRIDTCYWNGSAWITNQWDTPFTIADNSTTGLLDHQATNYCFVRGNALYVIVRVDDGTYNKNHLLKSTNKGVSWTDLGDVTQGIDVGIHRTGGPMNINEIPDNENFPLYSGNYVYDNVTGKVETVYLTECNFTSVAATSNLIYTDKYNSLAEFPDAYFGYEQDDLNTSGSAITRFNDKTGNARHANPQGSPTIVGGEIIFNGTSQGVILDPYIADLITHDKITLVAVALRSGTNSWLYTVGNTAASNDFLALGFTNNSTEQRVRLNINNPTNVLRWTGRGDTLTEYVVVRVQVNGLSTRFWINGQEENVLTEATSMSVQLDGKWAPSLSAPNTARIAMLRNAGTTYTAVRMKGWVYIPRVYTNEEAMKAENYFADAYGITVNRK